MMRSRNTKFFPIHLCPRSTRTTYDRQLPNPPTGSASEQESLPLLVTGHTERQCFRKEERHWAGWTGQSPAQSEVIQGDSLAFCFNHSPRRFRPLCSRAVRSTAIRGESGHCDGMQSMFAAGTHGGTSRVRSRWPRLRACGCPSTMCNDA